MKVLVTGAAGFIGSNFVHMLSTERPEIAITALDLLTYAGNLENIASLIESKRIKFERLDIVNRSAISELFERERFDIVIHFAAESHVDRSIHSAAAFVETNVLGTQNLLDASKAAGVKTFVHVSTDEVYGSLGPEGRFLETTPLDPTSPYSASKAASDLLALAMNKTHKLPVIVTRCTNNYGPYQFPEKFIPLFISNAMEDRELPLYGDGMNVRSWIHVSDHCAAVWLIAERGRAGEVYNIGGMREAELPNKEIAARILKHLGKSESLIRLVTDRLAHDRRYAVDNTKLRKELGWEPKVHIEEGLPATIEWYREHSAWWQAIKSGEYQRYYERNYAGR